MIYRGSPWETGSSPRMWGTRAGGDLGFALRRFIPTHVGNTEVARPSVRLPTVHPHARGEHGVFSPGCYQRNGSSPRTWGTRVIAIYPSLRVRFIPTHVGNTISERLPRNERPVHPHARGEHIRTRGFAGRVDGSSPRTWGTRALQVAVLDHLRFIPTHVGNTLTVQNCF